MAQPPLTQLLTEALTHHQAGRLPDAERLYRQVLATDPRHADALHLLGVIAHQVGRNDVAVDLIGKAIGTNGSVASFHSNLGNALRDLGRLDDALVAYRTAIRLKPDFAEALSNLGNALRGLGRLGDAVKAYHAAISLKPDGADAYSNLGTVLADLGRLDAAVKTCRIATRLKPGYAEAHYNLGNALNGLGRLDTARQAYGAAIGLKPDYAKAHANLGSVLRDLGRLDEAVSAYGTAISLEPNLAETHANLGAALTDRGAFDDAVNAYQTALRLKPDCVEAGMNLVFTQLYRPGAGLAGILEHSLHWNEQHAHRYRASWPAHKRPAHRDRRPRIGILSADLRSHAVGFLVIPAIEGLARAGHHLTCYSASSLEDSVTRRFIDAVSAWRPVAALSDDALAALIRTDEIDILIDLSGYTDGNRLLALARKPAPIQVASWVGYPGTTGMEAMDYILADRWQIPEGAEAFYSEKVVRLPDSYLAFEAPESAPSVPEMSARETGAVTFGSFNVLKKITPEVITVWSRILARLPTSRLLMKTKSLNSAAERRRFAELFATHGIGPERLVFSGGSSRTDHMAAMATAEIALDSFPYSGGLTTLESLWMGLPVITLPGETFASRHSLGYLSTLGLTELVATDPDHYVDLAVDLANDLNRLARLRFSMRPRMLVSSLCDVERFTGHLETALATMWKHWCDGSSAGFDVPANAIGHSRQEEQRLSSCVDDGF